MILRGCVDLSWFEWLLPRIQRIRRIDSVQYSHDYRVTVPKFPQITSTVSCGCTGYLWRGGMLFVSDQGWLPQHGIFRGMEYSRDMSEERNIPSARF